MKVLEYASITKQPVLGRYKKTIALLEKGDFQSAEVKKLTPTNYYRAKLDHTNRLLFQFVRDETQSYILVLEVIHQHNYANSRFLNGAKVQESKIILSPENLQEGELIRYINPKSRNFYFLDKVLSFDDLQQVIYQQPLPLIIIGSAGSGKTALTLEKMKHCPGEVLYVTHSPYLAKNAYQLYYSHGYASAHQTVEFLSYQELIETTAIPPGQEMTFSIFKQWLLRYSHRIFKDTNKCYEEIKGVITSNAGGSAYLSREAYLKLGVKQSIYLEEERAVVYDQFEKYLEFLQTSHYYDINIISHDWLSRCQPRYDYIVIDEVQDFTMVQLQFILKHLHQVDHFMLSGDANQIVHPNFFSWSKIQTLFYTGEVDHQKDYIQVLRTNYRNSPEVTYVANRILKIKNAALGSVDKASHALMKSQSTQTGHLHLMADNDLAAQELNAQTQNSTDYAVIVLHDEMKASARKHFNTPLIFSVRESKGLEYANIILYNMVSEESVIFRHLVKDVTLEELEGEMRYRRAKDKRDRSLEIYKFYINSLYVAITRSINSLYWIEHETKHPLFDRLQLDVLKEGLHLEKTESSIEVWQQEARKLALQGKQEQAEAIRDRFRYSKPNWEVLSMQTVRALYYDVVSPGRQCTKAKALALCEYANVYQDKGLLATLSKLMISSAKKPEKSLRIIEEKYYCDYASRNTRYVLEKTERYGIDFRNRFYQTPLMAAIYMENLTLVSCLLGCGANTELLDDRGRSPFQQTLYRTMHYKKFRQQQALDFMALLNPTEMKWRVSGRLVKIQAQQMEFLLYHVVFLWMSERLQCPGALPATAHFGADDLMTILGPLPERMVPSYRKKRRYLSAMLAKNERHRNDPYNRQLFVRIALGRYILNPDLAIQTESSWRLIYAFIKSHVLSTGQPVRHAQKDRVNHLLRSALIDPTL